MLSTFLKQRMYLETMRVHCNKFTRDVMLYDARILTDFVLIKPILPFRRRGTVA